MLRHEFWLKDYPIRGQSNTVYRIALGDLIDASERKTFPPAKYSNSPEFWNKSGSIGFMDITIKEQYVPPEGAGNSDIYNYQREKTLTILTLGIEPKYRGNDYPKILEKRAEELAAEWGLNTIIIDCIQNPRFVENPRKKALERLGYHIYDKGLYDMGLKAVKRTKLQQS